MADLEIERDDRFVANERRVHRVAVVVMTVLVLAGAAGVFGVGPLATVTRQGPGFTVTYDRFARNGAPMQFAIDQTGDGPLRVWMDQAVLDATELDQVVPAATNEQRTTAGATFTFPGSDTAVFSLTGDDVGVVRGRVGRSPDDAVPVTIILYP